MKFRSLIVILFHAVLTDAENRDFVPSEAPTNLTLLEIKERQVVIEWNEVKPESVRGNFRGYIVRTWNHAGSQVYAFPPDVTRAHVEFFPYSKNFITVSVRNEKYVGPPSEAISFRAPQIEPNFPYVVNAFPLSEKSLLLQWSKPNQTNGILIGYKIYCSIINDSLPFGEHEVHEVSHEFFDPDKLQAKLTGMQEGVKYKIGVAAINCAGESKRNSVEITLQTHFPSKPFIPKFHYYIDYRAIDTEEKCSNDIGSSIEAATDNPNEQNYDYYMGHNETEKTNSNENRLSSDDKDHCLVDCMILWIPDVKNIPGEYFYVKYRVRGEKEFQVTEPELSEDFLILNNFNACKNYEIIVTAVDGEFSTESFMLVTPTKIY